MRTTTSIAAAALTLTLATGVRADELTWALPESDCPGADFFYPGHGYDPLGYIHGGLLVRIQHVFRFSSSSPGEDEDWNFVIRPVDSTACPDGKHLMGRECGQARRDFVEVFWQTASEAWRAEQLYELVAHPLTSPLPLTPEDTAAVKTFRDAVAATPALSQAIAKVIGMASDPRLYRVGKALWSSAQLTTRFADYGYVEAEVQVSTLSPGGEAGASPMIPLTPPSVRMLKEAGLAECTDAGGLCGQDVLMFGTAAADTGHLGGKPELHPLRALVTTDAPKEGFAGSASYRVRSFADFGKAGDGGSGSIAGHICENWIDNHYDAGGYYSYFAIPPETFTMPTVYAYGGGTQVNATRCLVENAYQFGLHDFTPNSESATCPWVGGNPNYRSSDDQHRLYGGFAVTDVTTDAHLAGFAVHKIETTTVSLGIKRRGDALGPSVTADVEAHWFKVTATSRPTLGTRPISLDHVRWSIPAGVRAPRTDGPSIDVYVPIAPKRDAALAAYDFRLGAAGAYTGTTVPGSVRVSLPRPTTEAVGKPWGYETMTLVRGAGSYIQYKPTFTAAAHGLNAAPTFTWKLDSRPLASGPLATLRLAERDGAEDEALVLAATDGYEEATIRVQPQIPQTSVDAPEDIMVRGGARSSGQLLSVADHAGICATPVTFYSELKLTAQLDVPPNPYNVPPATGAHFTWSHLEYGAADTWSAYPGFTVASSAGTNQDTLTVKLGDLGSTTDFTKLREFRVHLGGTDAYGRTAQALVYFHNWTGDVRKATHCVSSEVRAKPSLPSWVSSGRLPNLGLGGPLGQGNPWDPHAGPHVDPGNVEAWSRLLVNRAGSGVQAPTYRPMSSHRTTRPIALPRGAPHPVPQLAAGAPITRVLPGPRIGGVAGSRKKLRDGGAIHSDLEKIRQMAPLLR